LAYDPADLKLPAWLLGALNTLIRMHVPIFPGWRLGFTRPGIIFVAGLAGVWAAAFYSGNNLLYLCAAMMLSLLLVALLQSAYLLHHLPAPALPLLEAGETTVMRHESTLFTAAVCSATVSVACAAGGESLQLNARCHGRSLRWNARLRVGRRGLFICREMLLNTAAPLGMFVLCCKRSVSIELLVLPVPVAWVQGAASGDGSEDLRAGDEWHDLRAYVAGDSPRRVHWRKAQGEPATWSVKRFSAARDAQVNRCLRVDLRLPPGRPESDFERLLGQAWFWVKQWGDLPAGDQSVELIVGRERFDLGDTVRYELALRALAGAQVAVEPPAGEEGLLLSLAETG